MEKGIDVKIIAGNTGIPKPVMTDKMRAEIQEWRLACETAQNSYWDRLRNINNPITEDIDHIEVTDEEIQIGWDKLQKQLTK